MMQASLQVGELDRRIEEERLRAVARSARSRWASRANGRRRRCPGERRRLEAVPGAARRAQGGAGAARGRGAEGGRGTAAARTRRASTALRNGAGGAAAADA